MSWRAGACDSMSGGARGPIEERLRTARSRAMTSVFLSIRTSTDPTHALRCGNRPPLTQGLACAPRLTHRPRHLCDIFATSLPARPRPCARKSFPNRIPPRPVSRCPQTRPVRRTRYKPPGPPTPDNSIYLLLASAKLSDLSPSRYGRTTEDV